jgi:hypothetical protein
MSLEKQIPPLRCGMTIPYGFVAGRMATPAFIMACTSKHRSLRWYVMPGCFMRIFDGDL